MQSRSDTYSTATFGHCIWGWVGPWATSDVSTKKLAILLATCLLAGFAEMFSSTLKMEAICSSETSVSSQQTTRRHIPEDDTLHNHRCENLKSYKLAMGYSIAKDVSRRHFRF
jgi:hypothetical protein